MKTTAAACLAIALAWAAPALAQDSPPQERIHERLDVSFRDAAGEEKFQHAPPVGRCRTTTLWCLV
jgi:hypothetical protein